MVEIDCPYFFFRKLHNFIPHRIIVMLWWLSIYRILILVSFSDVQRLVRNGSDVYGVKWALTVSSWAFVSSSSVLALDIHFSNSNQFLFSDVTTNNQSRVTFLLVRLLTFF